MRLHSSMPFFKMITDV